MRCTLSLRAEEDLIHIYVTGAHEFGLAQADRYQDGLEQAFDLIAAYPLAGRERTEIDPPIRIHLYQSHIILYVIEENEVRILRVRHGREDWDSAL